MENNKQKIAIVALIALLVVGAIGVTIAYFTSETIFKNEFKTPAHESEFTEEFSSPENWLPGDEEKKEVSVKNTGEYDIAVRISYTEEWIGADSTTQLPLIQDQDGTEVRAAIINFPNKDDWGKRTEEDGVTYYYYKDILGKDESTSLFMDKVTFNKDIKQAENCTNVYNYKDGTTSTGDSPEEGKTVTSTTRRCESTGQTYAGGTYILTIKIETIQWDQYKNGWGLEEDLKDLEWEKTLNSVMKQKAVLDNIKSEFVESTTGIDFKLYSSDTNGKGLYIYAGTENNEYPVYYYRGDVKDNNIIFADFCWKIVRTTETGGVKLIYNGVPNNGICNNTKAASEIGQSVFNSSKNNLKYIGYMYDGNISSTIKKVIDNWYEQNLLGTEYESQIENEIWCVDRSMREVSGSYVYYGHGTRIELNKERPLLTCSNIEDSYTVKGSQNSNGNELLNYSIALLTGDEAQLAGYALISDNGNTKNKNIYLYNESYSWLLSPRAWNNYSSIATVSGIDDQMESDHVDCYHGVRPSISLKNGIAIISGDGTANSPYQIEM